MENTKETFLRKMKIAIGCLGIVLGVYRMSAYTLFIGLGLINNWEITPQINPLPEASKFKPLRRGYYLAVGAILIALGVFFLLYPWFFPNRFLNETGKHLNLLYGGCYVLWCGSVFLRRGIRGQLGIFWRK